MPVTDDLNASGGDLTFAELRRAFKLNSLFDALRKYNEFAEIERPASSVWRATSVQIFRCDDSECGRPHLVLFDDNHIPLAGAILSKEIVEVLARLDRVRDVSP